MIRRRAAGAIMAGLVAVSAVPEARAARTYIPVVSGQFSMGQWYFEGQRSSLGGNASLLFAPAVRYTNRFSMIPSFQTAYRGTRSVEELAGGNTLFQDTWENAAGLKFVHGLNPNWTLREKVGARMKWFRETTDESWNDGLYDYRIFDAGLELERNWNKKSALAFGYNFSLLRFPNYQSLESSQSNALSREFAGERVLDADSHLVTIDGRMPGPAATELNLQIYASPRFFTDQTVVRSNGLFESTKREDLYTGLSAGVGRPFRTSASTRLLARLNYGYVALDSNQNHYDARQTLFQADYYDYAQHSLGTSLTLAFGRPSLPMALDLGFSVSRRFYDKRVAQSAAGDYGSDKLVSTDRVLALAFSYPISKTFSLRTSTTASWTRSNNQYEALYRYNYDNMSYQVGFTYDY